LSGYCSNVACDGRADGGDGTNAVGAAV
jgi:hypothetical protein